ncbi:MAG: hypothetical protein J0L92_04515 [Deltaproteobacteria bacterium]|nr:hypothetical protein [Deltaproteobacteria bacterium]
MRRAARALIALSLGVGSVSFAARAQARMIEAEPEDAQTVDTEQASPSEAAAALAAETPPDEPIVAAESDTLTEAGAATEAGAVTSDEARPLDPVDTDAESVPPLATVEEAAEDSTPVDVEPARRLRWLDDLRLGLDDSGLDDAAWVSFGVFAGDVRNDAITMGTIDVGLRLAIAPDARATLDWGVAFADAHVRGAYNGATVEPFDARTGRVEGRNADLRFEWLPLVGRDVRFGFGVGVAVPVAATTRLPFDAASQADFDASSLTHEAYLAQNGAYRAWRYRPERVAVYVPLTLAIALSDDAVLALDGAGAVGVRVLGGMGQEVLGDLVLGAEIGAGVASFLRLGARAQVAALAVGTPSSAAQPSVEGWARLELAPVSVLVRATLGLGGPYGVGSDFVGWGLHAGAGAVF